MFPIILSDGAPRQAVPESDSSVSEDAAFTGGGFLSVFSLPNPVADSDLRPTMTPLTRPVRDAFSLDTAAQLMVSNGAQAAITLPTKQPISKDEVGNQRIAPNPAMPAQPEGFFTEDKETTGAPPQSLNQGDNTHDSEQLRGTTTPLRGLTEQRRADSFDADNKPPSDDTDAPASTQIALAQPSSTAIANIPPADVQASASQGSIRENQHAFSYRLSPSGQIATLRLAVAGLSDPASAKVADQGSTRSISLPSGVHSAQGESDTRLSVSSVEPNRAVIQNTALTTRASALPTEAGSQIGSTDPIYPEHSKVAPAAAKSGTHPDPSASSQSSLDMPRAPGRSNAPSKLTQTPPTSSNTPQSDSGNSLGFGQRTPPDASEHTMLASQPRVETQPLQSTEGLGKSHGGRESKMSEGAASVVNQPVQGVGFAAAHNSAQQSVRRDVSHELPQRPPVSGNAAPISGSIGANTILNSKRSAITSQSAYVPFATSSPDTDQGLRLDSVELDGVVPGTTVSSHIATTAIQGATGHTQQSHLGASVAAQVAVAVSEMNDGKIEVSLAPEELGKVRLTLNSLESGLSVSIHADRPETLDLMRRHISDLARDLADLGYENVAFDFGGTQTGQNSFQNEPGTSEEGEGEMTPETRLARSDTSVGTGTTSANKALESGLDLRI